MPENIYIYIWLILCTSYKTKFLAQIILLFCIIIFRKPAPIFRGHVSSIHYSIAIHFLARARFSFYSKSDLAKHAALPQINSSSLSGFILLKDTLPKLWAIYYLRFVQVFTNLWGIMIENESYFSVCDSIEKDSWQRTLIMAGKYRNKERHGQFW